ncbi:MAG: SdpI family protein [Cumulibacter sp.]
MFSAMVGLLFVGVLFIVVSFAMRGPGLTRNRAVGIRTKATLASDAAWASGHKAAAPWILSAGILSTVMGLGALTLTVTAGKDGLAPGVAPVYVTLAFLFIIVLVLVATVIANRAARNESAHSANQQSEGES